MNAQQEQQLRELVLNRSTAALGTLHDGAPYVSMVPFVLVDDATRFIIHVSRLAAHTQDMLMEPRISLMIAAAEQVNLAPQALPRVTVTGTARQLSHDSPEYARARDAYLARFPDSAVTFRLADFSLFAIVPERIRWVAGFAQARTLTPRGFARAVTGQGDV